MHKEELVTAIAEKLNIPKVVCKDFLEIFTEVITTTLQHGETVQLIGFGSFAVNVRAERKGRNPSNGKEITIAASKAIKFKAGKQLKDAVNS